MHADLIQMHNHERLPEAHCLNLTHSNITFVSECEGIPEYRNLIFIPKDVPYVLVDKPVLSLKDVIHSVRLTLLLIVR